MKDPYQLPSGYLLNPFNCLYQPEDIPISSNTAIQETIQNVLDIDYERLDLDLPYIEHLIQYDTLAYVRKGCLYATILFKKLYKKTHSNFKLYCQQVIGRSEKSVRIDIEASRITLELIHAGFEYEQLPLNSSQCYQLRQYTSYELVDKWRFVLANIERHKITANSIHDLLYPPIVNEETINTKVKLPLETFNRLMEVAYHAQLSIAETLDAVLFVLTKAIKKDDILRLLRWILDMVDLAESEA